MNIWEEEEEEGKKLEIHQKTDAIELLNDFWPVITEEKGKIWVDSY